MPQAKLLNRNIIMENISFAHTSTPIFSLEREYSGMGLGHMAGIMLRIDLTVISSVNFTLKCTEIVCRKCMWKVSFLGRYRKGEHWS